MRVALKVSSSIFLDVGEYVQQKTADKLQAISWNLLSIYWWKYLIRKGKKTILGAS